MDLPWWRWQTSFISKVTGYVFPVTQSFKYTQNFIYNLVVTTTTGKFFLYFCNCHLQFVFWLCITFCNSVSTTLVIKQCSQTITFFRWGQFFEVFALAVQFNQWLLICFPLTCCKAYWVFAHPKCCKTLVVQGYFWLFYDLPLILRRIQPSIPFPSRWRIHSTCDHGQWHLPSGVGNVFWYSNYYH